MNYRRGLNTLGMIGFVVSLALPPILAVTAGILWLCGVLGGTALAVAGVVWVVGSLASLVYMRVSHGSARAYAEAAPWCLAIAALFSWGWIPAGMIMKALLAGDKEQPPTMQEKMRESWTGEVE